MSKGSGRLARSVLCSIEFDFCKISACRFSLSRMFPCSALKNLGLSHKGGTVWDQNVPQFASNSIFERERPNSIFERERPNSDFLRENARTQILRENARTRFFRENVTIEDFVTIQDHVSPLEDSYL